tara:strand:- start:2933 stop:3271 length:339 start_codon:yes stop_codon:yes gene_type:complete
MKYYHKYEKALVASGYTVDTNGYVWDSMGNQAAGEDNYGNVQSKDPNVTHICQVDELSGTARFLAKTKAITKQVKAKSVKVIPEGKKRARTTKGHYVADDPSTPENEAWVDK